MVNSRLHHAPLQIPSTPLPKSVFRLDLTWGQIGSAVFKKKTTNQQKNPTTSAVYDLYVLKKWIMYTSERGGVLSM